MIDEQVGRILDGLSALHLRERTLIIYTSDHGQCVGHHGVRFKGNSTLPQNFFDESLSIPLIVNLPGVVAEGVVSDVQVGHIDTHATLVEVAGTQEPDDAPRPGKSWMPLAEGKDTAWGDRIFAEYGNARMIRTPEFKLIRRYPGLNGRFPDELYDRVADPRETTNLISSPHSRPAIDALSIELDSYFGRFGRAECDGRSVSQRPKHNEREPWRVNT
jgi:arylsulfatase A-like enzyme